MGWRRACLLVTALGCNQVFGIRETGLNDGAVGEGSIGSIGIPFDATYCRTFVPLTEYDTYLVDSTARGSADAMIAAPTNPALVRFDLDAKIQSGERIAAAQLEVQLTHNARECSTDRKSCAPCTNQATEWIAYWNTTSWSESATSTTPWQEPFATGSADRSAEVARGSLVAGADSVKIMLDYPAVDAVPPKDPFVTSDDLSVQLRTASGTIALSTTEGNQPCDAPRINAPPTITLVLCH